MYLAMQEVGEIHGALHYNFFISTRS